jgi:hypothetical protein
MFSGRRRSLPSETSSFTSFSTDNSYRRTIRRSSPVALRHLVVRDLDDNNPTHWNQSLSRRRGQFRIPRPILTIPRSSIHVPSRNSLWTIDGRSAHEEEFSSLPNRIPRTHISERPFYQIATPPPSPSPPPIVHYQIVPVPVQRPSPIYTLRRNKKKRYLKEKTPGLCATLCSGGLGTLAVLIYLSFAFALPTTKLVLGILYIDECPVNRNIPLYMIVSGAAGLGIILFLLLSSGCTFCRSSTTARKSTHKFMICTIAFARGMQGAIAIFLFIWFFIGNFWVFGARYRVRTDSPGDSNNYCHPALYWFAFYVLIFTYVYAICMCFMKFCANFLCCGACDIWKRAFS